MNVLRSSANSRTLTEAETERLTLRGETFVAAWSALLLSLFAISYSHSRGLMLLYGDAVAHLNCARKVIDSLHPGLAQLGTVWLPLPHLLMVPFVWRVEWWQSGLAGAFPSMAAYILGTAGIYRLARLWLPRSTALIAPLFFGLNPGLLYMQTTAMTEPLFLAEMIWAVVLIVEFARALDKDEIGRAAKLLVIAGIVLVAAVYTRYDGWVYAFVAWLVALRKMLRTKRWKSAAGGAFLLVTVLLAAAPIVWLAFCAQQTGDPLTFMRGPYSAKAIEARTSKPGLHYPGWHNMGLAAVFFVKAAELGASPLHLSDLLLPITIIGGIAGTIRWRAQDAMTALLLWVPLPFYAYSVAYGSVPIFFPPWVPNAWYNTRYGMELLPVFALSLAFLVACLADWFARRRPSVARWAPAAAALLVVANNGFLLYKRPLVLDEAISNSRHRVPFEVAYANALQSLPPNSIVLANTPEWVGAYQRAGFPFKRTITQADYEEWQAGLKNPAKVADFVVAIEGDRLTQAVADKPEGLTLINIVCSTHQPCARFYSSDRHSPGGSITQK